MLRMGQLPPFCFCSLSDSKRRKLVSKFEVMWFFFRFSDVVKRKTRSQVSSCLTFFQVLKLCEGETWHQISSCLNDLRTKNWQIWDTNPEFWLKKRARSPMFIFCRVSDLVFAEPNGSRQKHNKLLVLKAFLNAMFCDVLCWVKILGDSYGPKTPRLR